jgi:hypothetical protein
VSPHFFVVAFDSLSVDTPSVIVEFLRQARKTMGGVQMAEVQVIKGSRKRTMNRKIMANVQVRNM